MNAQEPTCDSCDQPVGARAFDITVSHEHRLTLCIDCAERFANDSDLTEEERDALQSKIESVRVAAADVLLRRLPPNKAEALRTMMRNRGWLAPDTPPDE